MFPFVVAIVMISNSAWNTSKNSKDDLAVSSIPILEAQRKRHYEDLGKSSASTLDYEDLGKSSASTREYIVSVRYVCIAAMVLLLSGYTFANIAMIF